MSISALPGFLRHKILFFLLVLSMSLRAQQIKEADSSLAVKNKLIVLPIAFYTPETKLAFGAIGIYLFKSGHDINTRTSNFDFALVHTTKDQSIIEPTYTIYTKGEKFYVRGTWICALKASELYFDPARKNHKQDAFDITYSAFKFNNRFLFRVFPHGYFGLKQQFNKPYNIELGKKIKPYTKKSIDSIFAMSSGIGPDLLYDTRDNIINSYKGVFFELGLTFFNKKFGSGSNFTNIVFDGRVYKRLNPKGILALNTISIFNVGDYPPIQQLASIGGSAIMRGFYRDRFKERHAIIFQTEYRHHIYKKFGMTVFAGVGEVARVMSDFDLRGLNYSYGTGLRYMIKKSERLNLRLDLGFGNNDSKGVYAGISEAF